MENDEFEQNASGIEENRRLTFDFEDFKKRYITAGKSLIEILPIISLFGLIYGSSRIYFYYRMFDINIFNYIELSEILNITIKDMLSLLVLSFLLFSIYLMYFGASGWKGRLLLVGGLVGFISLIIYLSDVNLTQLIEIIQWFVISLVFCVMFFVAGYMFQKNTKLIVMLTVLLLVVVAWRMADGYHYLVLKRQATAGNSIRLKRNETISSSGKLYYLGKTAHYVFFFDKDSSIVKPYRVEEIESLSIKSDL